METFRSSCPTASAAWRQPAVAANCVVAISVPRIGSARGNREVNPTEGDRCVIIQISFSFGNASNHRGECAEVISEGLTNPEVLGSLRSRKQEATNEVMIES